MRARARARQAATATCAPEPAVQQRARNDVRNATCRKRENTESILAELERDVGLVECNRLVLGNGA